MVCVLLGVAYASLPAWLPARWLARRIEWALAGELQRPVSIGRLRVGWIDGLVLESIAVGDLPDSPNPHLVHIERLRCEFTPILTLASGRLKQLELDRPELWLVRDPEGRLNIEKLPQPQRRRLPSFIYSLKDATCHVWTPQARQTFRIDTLHCRLEPERALLDLNGRALVPETGAGSLSHEQPRGHATSHIPEDSFKGRLGFSARLTVPRLRKDLDLALSGAVQVEWSDLAVSDLPLSLFPQLPVQQVGGRSSGMVSLETRPDLSIDFKQRIEAQGVRLTWAGLSRPAVLPDAALRVEGRWEPESDRLTIRDLEYETPGLRLSGQAGQAVRIDPRGGVPLEMNLEGEIKSWELLRREVPHMDKWADSLGISLAGRERFALRMKQRGDEGQVVLALDGGQSRWSVGRTGEQMFEAGESVRKHLRLTASGDFVSGRVQPSVQLALGDLSFNLKGEGRLPAEWASRVAQIAEDGEYSQLPAEERVHGARPTEAWWESLSADLELSTEHLEQAVALFPSAQRRPEVASWCGPMRARMKLTPAPGGSRLDVNWRTDAATTLGWGQWFKKPPGRPLTATARLTVPHGSAGRVDDLSLEVAYGQGKLEIAEGRATLRYDLARGDDIEAELSLPVRIDRVQELAGLCPRWEALIREGTERLISGSLSIAARAEAFRRAGEKMTRLTADMDAGGLDIRWGDKLCKPEGEPLAVRLVGHSQVTRGQRENWLGAAVDHPAGEFEAALTRTGPSSTRESAFEHCSVEMRTTDLDRLLKRSPSLAELLREYQAAGSAEAHVNAIAAGGSCSADLSVDAGGAEFTLPGETPGIKQRGVPAELSLRWESEAETSAPEGAWHLAAGQAQLVGLSVTKMSGRVEPARWPEHDASARELEHDGELEAASAGSAPPLRLVEAIKGLRRISAAHLQLEGTAACDPQLERLYPHLARLRERFGLSGGVEWKAQVSGNDEALHFAGRLDAGNLAWSAPTGEPASPIIRKPAGVPAAVAVELAAVPGPDGPDRRIDARVDVDLDGNRLRAEAHALMAGWSEGLPRADNLDVLASLSLNQPERLLEMAPGSAVQAIKGSGAIELGIERRGKTTRLTGVHANFQNLAIRSNESGVTLDGAGSWEPAGVRVPGLGWKWGQSAGKIEGRMSFLEGGAQGRIGLAADRLDVPDLQRQFSAWTGPLGIQPPVAAPAGQSEEYNRLTRTVLSFLGRSDLHVSGQIAALEVVLPPGIPVRGGLVLHNLRAERGPLSFTFAGTVDGGAVEGRVEVTADAADPRMRLTYTAERIRPGPLVDAYLARTFPGMTATGPLTLIDESNQKLLPAPGELNGPTGTGELIIHGGRLMGRAAPRVITRIFPGLNLASFEFSYMHSWFRKEVTGRIYHQMIYQGKYYNMYMTGYSEPAGFRYEIGVDFLAQFDSKYWAESGQGRIPLFTKTGRLELDGSIADEEVVYMPERFFDTVLVKNNPVFTAYHAVRKRVREGK